MVTLAELLQYVQSVYVIILRTIEINLISIFGFLLRLCPLSTICLLNMLLLRFLNRREEIIV